MAVSNFVESVEFIEYTLGATALSGSVTLSGSQDLSNCVPFMTAHAGSDYIDSHMLDIYFESSATVVFKRIKQRNNAVTIRCYIIEFNPDEVRVQQGSFDLNDQNTDTITLDTTLSGIDRAAMTHFWWSSSTSQTGQYHFVRGRVLDTSSIDFYRYNTGASCRGHWFLFEDLGDNFRVRHHSHSYSSSGETTRIHPDRHCIDPLRSFLIGSYASASNYTYPSRWSARIFFYSDGTVRSDKHDANYHTVYWSYQCVEFLDKTKVYTPFDNHLLNSLASDESSKTTNRGDNVNISPLKCNPATSSVVVAGPQGVCRINSTSTSEVNQLFVSVKLVDGDSLYFQRSGSGYSTYLSTVTAVDWAGIDIDIGSNDDPIPEGDGPEQSFVKSVENFRMTVEQNFNYRLLSKGQDWKNCAIFASHRSTSGDYMRSIMHNVYLLEPGIVCAFRWDTGGQGIVDVSVVEFWPDQVKVQHKNTTVYGGNTITVPIEEVSDTNKCFILSKTFSSASQYRTEDSMVRVRFSDESNVELYRYYIAYEVDTSFFVVEDLKNNFVTRHFTGSSSSNWMNIYDDEHLSGIYNTFLLCSYASANSSSYPTRGMVRSFLAHEDWARVKKYDSSYYTVYYHVTIIKFVSSKYRINFFYTYSSDSTYTFTFSAYFSEHTNALTCFNNVQSSVIECSSTSSSAISEAFGTIRITDYETRELEMSKNGSSATSYGVFIMIDWIGYHHQHANNIRKAVPTRSVVKSIEKLDYYNSSSVWDVQLNKGQNIRQCVPFMTNSANTDDAYVSRLYKRIHRFEDPDYFVVRFGSGSAGNRHVTLYIVEFNDNVKIQHGNTISNGTTATAVIEEVNLDRSFLIAYGVSSAWKTYASPYTICNRFKSSTELEFIRTNSSDEMFVSWYVVECPDDEAYWKVEHLYKTGLGGSSNVHPVMTKKPAFERTMLLSTWASTSSNSYPSRGLYRMFHRQDEKLQFNKYDGGSYNMNNVGVEIIEFSRDLCKKGFKSYSDFMYLPSNTTSGVETIHSDEGFDLSRSIVMAGNLNNESRVDSTSSDVWDAGFLHYKLKDDKTVVARKVGGTTVTTYSFFYVYRFPEYNKYFVEGYVKEKGNPVQREVCMYRTSTGELTDKVISASGTGYFWLETPYGEEHHVVCLDDEAKPDYNHLIYGKVMPTVISGSYPYNEGLIDTEGFDEGIPLIFQEDYS